MKFDTKIAVFLRDDLPVWQQLNMPAFLVSGIASTNEGVTGENYEAASGNVYLPMFIQPVLIFGGTTEQLREVYERAFFQKMQFAIFTEELFSSGHDGAERNAVKADPRESFKNTGIALRVNK